MEELDIYSLSDERQLADSILSEVVDKLCYDKSHDLTPNKLKKLEILMDTLKIDNDTLEAAYYYQQPAQKQWLDKVVEATESALSKGVFTNLQSQIVNQQIIQSISAVSKIYKTGKEKLIECLQQLIDIKREKIKKKIAIVDQKLEKFTKPQDISMQRGYGNFFTPVKYKEGFIIPHSKNNINERKRELKNNNPQQSNKRIMLEQNPQQEKNNDARNKESTLSSTEGKSNNNYQNS